MTAVETRNDRDDAAADMQVAMADKEATAAPDQPDVVKDISDRVCRLLECPVCLSLATRMACLCANGHMVCTSCLMLLNRRTPAPGCPMCRSPIVCNAYTSAASSGLSLITSAMKVACPHRGYGCAELFRLDQVTFHESECAYMPTARCLSFMCQWVGANGQLYEHVRRFHRHASVVKTSRNQLSVHDANSITSHRRRSYLVHSPIGLFWVLLFRVTRNRFRIGVFFVHQDTDVQSSAGSDNKKMYRVIWSDVEGRHRNQSSLAFVGCSTSLKSWAHKCIHMDHSYTTIKRNTGRLVIHWYESCLNR